MNDFPENLCTQEFHETWLDYVEYRQQRKPKLTAIGMKRLLGRLAKWGNERAVAALDYSMAQGWQGVFEEKGADTAIQSLRRFVERGR